MYNQAGVCNFLSDLRQRKGGILFWQHPRLHIINNQQAETGWKCNGGVTFSVYLYGHAILLGTDHSSLPWQLGFWRLEGQVACWLEVLSAFIFSVDGCPGRSRVSVRIIVLLSEIGEWKHRGWNGRPALSGSLMLYLCGFQLCFLFISTPMF